MITTRLQDRLHELKTVSPTRFNDPSFTIPVKVSLRLNKEPGVELKIGSKGIRKSSFTCFDGIGDFITELQEQNSSPVTYASTEYGYFLVPLSVRQIEYFSKRPYVLEIDDDSPLL